MSALVIHREVRIELGVDEMACAFAALDHSSQAAFFCEVGRLAGQLLGGWEQQAALIVNSMHLGNEGATVLRALGEHFAATERVPG
jgi:hypothetical protein